MLGTPRNSCLEGGVQLGRYSLRIDISHTKLCKVVSVSSVVKSRKNKLTIDERQVILLEAYAHRIQQQIPAIPGHLKA